LWGSGSPRREFLHVDDLADACLFIMSLEDKAFHSLLSLYQTPLINIGWGKDISIKELTVLIKEVTGFEGDFIFDTTKPDGTPQKLLDVRRLSELGWQAKISLRDGIRKTYDWCLKNSAF
jgi:GDP-L-fucose synthase